MEIGLEWCFTQWDYEKYLCSVAAEIYNATGCTLHVSSRSIQTPFLRSQKFKQLFGLYCTKDPPLKQVQFTFSGPFRRVEDGSPQKAWSVTCTRPATSWFRRARWHQSCWGGLLFPLRWKRALIALQGTLDKEVQQRYHLLFLQPPVLFFLLPTVIRK